MVSAQVERLRKDSDELEIYAQKLEKKGQTQRANKIKKKREFILRALSKKYAK
jgi:hypothetical protein|tara:strand:- start:290 stop:448 length:159 start_codon:yes stop_codon:yes gene_type:complete